MLRSFWFVRPRDYYTKESAGVIDWQRNGEPLDGDGCFTTQITEDAVRLFGLHLIGSQFVRFPNTGRGATLFSQCARDVGTSFSDQPRNVANSECIDQLVPKFILPDEPLP